MHSPILPLPPSRYSTFLSSCVLLFSSRHPTAMLSCFLSFLSFLPPSVLSFWFLMWFCLLKGANSFPCTCSVVDVMECVQRLCVHIHASAYAGNSSLRAQNLYSRKYILGRTIHLVACELVLLLGTRKDPEI